MRWFSALRALLGHDPARDKGARGEDLAAAKLAEKGWFRVKGLCLRNLYLPAGEGATTEVDLIYLTRKGIYVLESKNYTGRIYGQEHWQEWTASVCVGRGWLGRPKTRQHSFYNPIRQNAGHIRALRELVGEEVPLWSVIVFSGRCRLADVEWDRDDTAVCRVEQLPRTLRKLGRRKVLSRRQVRELYDQLEPYTRVAWGEKFAHLCQVQEKEQAAAHPRRCPWCGGTLVLRTARQGRYAGRSFYGCSNYPRCRYKRDV